MLNIQLYSHVACPYSCSCASFPAGRYFNMHAFLLQVFCSVKEEALDAELRAPEILLPLSVRVEKKQVSISALPCAWVCTTEHF